MNIDKIIYASFLFALEVFAYPRVGDFAKYEADYQGFKVVFERTVLKQDHSTRDFIVKTELTYRNQVLKNETHRLPFSFMYNESKYLNLINTCEKREGAITLIKFGHKVIKSCEFYNEDSQLTNIIGGVPFGDIRFQLYLGEGEFLDFNLVKYEG